MIKYQKNFRIYVFLIHISRPSLLLNNKKPYLYPIKYQKKFHIYAFLIHILHPSLLLNNKNHFYTLLVIKYQKKFRIYNFLFISHALHALHSFPTIKKSFLHHPSNKISKEISYLYLLNSYLMLLTPSQQ